MQIQDCTKKEVRFFQCSLDYSYKLIIKIAMKLHYGDLNDSSSLVKLIASIKPTEIYNLGAQSHVKVIIYYDFILFK